MTGAAISRTDSLKRLDGGAQATLVSCRRILVNDLFVSNRINDALGLLEDSLSGSLVTDGNCLANFLDRST
jgi:hypothetical protein